MTEKVHLSFNRTIRNREVSAAIRYGGGTDGWIASADERLVEDSEGDLAAGPLAAFDHAGSNGLDVTIDTGEALVEGAYLATDDQHTVSLTASTADQTVYVGWRDGAADTIVVGLDTAFAGPDHRIAAWSFDTDGSGVTAVVDERDIGSTATPDQLRAQDVLRVPVYASKADIPTDLPEGTIVFAQQETSFFGEDGTN